MCQCVCVCVGGGGVKCSGGVCEIDGTYKVHVHVLAVECKSSCCWRCNYQCQPKIMCLAKNIIE